MLIEQVMPSFEGVAAGQTAVCKLPIGRRFHELQLAYSGVTLAQIDELRVIANTKVIHRYSGDQRDTMNQFDGLAAAAGILNIPFIRKGMKQREAEEVTALNTGSVGKGGEVIGQLTIEVDINAAAVGSALSMTATQSDSIPGGPGAVMHIRQYTRTPAGAGLADISDIPYGQATSQALNRVFMNSANITDVEVERGLYNIFKRSATLNNVIQTDGERVPQANWFVLDPSERGYGGNLIDLVGYSNFSIKPTMAAGGAIVMIMEHVGLLGN